MRPCSYMRSGLCPAGVYLLRATLYTLYVTPFITVSASATTTPHFIHHNIYAYHKPSNENIKINLSKSRKKALSLVEVSPLSLLEPFARGRWDGRTVPRLDKVFLSQSFIHLRARSLRHPHNLPLFYPLRALSLASFSDVTEPRAPGAFHQTSFRKFQVISLHSFRN